VLTNTKISTDETDSQKALSAAQAGVEQKLKTQTIGSETIDFSSNNSSVTTVSNSLSGSQLLINGGSQIARDDGADIWLSDFGPGTDPTYANPWNGNLKIYWKDNSPSDCTKNAAMEIVVISGSTAAPLVTRYAFDTCASSRNNGFSSPSPESKTISGVKFDHSVLIPITSGLIARVIPLYAGTSVMAEGYGASTSIVQNLPAQGYVIEATGTAGNATRRIRVFQGFPKLPTEYFPYSFFQP